MKYCIVLRSKHTGEEIHLGSQYESIKEAQEEIDNGNICDECNGVSIEPIYAEDPVWVNKKYGFVERSMAKEVKETWK